MTDGPKYQSLLHALVFDIAQLHPVFTTMLGSNALLTKPYFGPFPAHLIESSGYNLAIAQNGCKKNNLHLFLSHQGGYRGTGYIMLF